jgi:SAM-dependent methyltransferase
MNCDIEYFRQFKMINLQEFVICIIILNFMNLQHLKNTIEGIDIYILDQILKHRFQENYRILDAGCGSGRNLKWFYASNFEIYGIDISIEDIEYCKNIYPKQKQNFNVASIDKIPYKTNFFEYIICNAVLHFANDRYHFNIIFKELVRVLKPTGILFIRMASNFGMEHEVSHIANSVYKLPDGTERFLLTKKLLKQILNEFNLKLIEDLKTTIVHSKRCMTTLVFELEK